MTEEFEVMVLISLEPSVSPKRLFFGIQSWVLGLQYQEQMYLQQLFQYTYEFLAWEWKQVLK